MTINLETPASSEIKISKAAPGQWVATWQDFELGLLETKPYPTRALAVAAAEKRQQKLAFSRLMDGLTNSWADQGLISETECALLDSSVHDAVWMDAADGDDLRIMLTAVQILADRLFSDQSPVARVA